MYFFRHHARALLAAFLLAIIFAGPAVAQPSGYFKYLEQFDAAERGSTEQLDFLFKMIDVVFHYDLDQAIELAEQGTTLAREFGNQDAEAAFLMDHATWIAYKHGSGEAEKYFNEALEKFNEEGDPRFRAHFYSARFGYALINEEEEYDPNLYLELEKELAQSLGDPHLMMSYFYMAATSKVFVGKLPPDDEFIIPLRENLKALADEHDFETGQLNLLLLEAREQQLAGKEMQAAMTLMKTIKFAEDSNYRIFEVRAQLALAYGQLHLALDSFVETNGPPESWDEEKRKEFAKRVVPVRDRYQHSLEVAQQVKMSAYTFESLVYLAYCEFHCGNSEVAMKYIDQAEALPYRCFRSWVLRDRLYRYAVTICSAAGDEEKLRQYVNKLASTEHVEKFNEAAAKSIRFRQQLTALKEKSREIQTELVASRDQEKQRADWLGTMLVYSLIGLGFAGLTSALIWNQRRLGNAQAQLNDKQESLLENVKIRKVLEDRVGRLQRMESLGMLAGGIAHDFNNLLVGVISNAEMLQQEGKFPDNYSRERVDGIINSAEKAADLSRQMLAYTGKQLIVRETFDLNRICNEMTRILRASAGDGVDLVVQTSPTGIPVEVDRTQVEQVLLNLTNNARQASKPGGRIVIQTGIETITEVGSQYHGTRTDGGFFGFVEVSDNGSGFNAQETSRIFEPFYSISDHGRGLGLSVVYGIVNGHEGLVRAESVPGKGSDFRILFPLSKSAVELSQAVDDPTGSLSDARDMAGKSSEPPILEQESKRRLLVADDEPVIRDLLFQLLTRQGWDVLLAKNGNEAISLLKTWEIDLVMLDVVMPDVDGAEVLTFMRDNETNVPVILVSGYSTMRLDEYRNYSQVCEVVCKPFKIPQLLGAIETAWQKSTGLRVKRSG